MPAPSTLLGNWPPPTIMPAAPAPQPQFFDPLLIANTPPSSLGYIPPTTWVIPNPAAAAGPAPGFQIPLPFGYSVSLAPTQNVSPPVPNINLNQLLNNPTGTLQNAWQNTMQNAPNPANWNLSAGITGTLNGPGLNAPGPISLTPLPTSPGTPPNNPGISTSGILPAIWTYLQQNAAPVNPPAPMPGN